MKTSKSRKTAVAGSVAALLLSVSTSTALAQTTLVLNATELGPMREALSKHLPAFEKENNVKVQLVAGLGAPTVTMARNKEVDVLITDPVYSLQMQKEDLLVPLDKKLIPNLAHLYPSAILDPYQAVLYYGSFGLCYLKDKTGPIESWSDLWRDNLKGKVSVRNYRIDSISLLVTMAKAAGGDERKPDAGFKKMAELAPSIPKFYANWGDLATMFRTEQIWVATCTNGRGHWLAADQKLPVSFVNPKPGGFALIGTLQVVKGRPNTELAMKLVNFLLDVDTKMEMARVMNYGPSNSKVKLPPDLAARLPSSREEVESLISIDWDYVNANNQSWEERWNREVAFR